MPVPPLETLVSYVTICVAGFGALFAALWISLVFWAFRDMRARSRDPFAQLLAALVVAALPVAGILIYWILRPPETLAEAYERALEEEALLQEIEERPACPGCSRVVHDNWIVCPHCHTRLRKVCPDCGQRMDLQWNLCAHCGSQFVDPYRVDAPITTSGPLPDEAEMEPILEDIYPDPDILAIASEPELALDSGEDEGDEEWGAGV